MTFDPNKLLKTLTAGHGAILAPHIEAYQRQGKFPKKWIIEIQNKKPDDGHFHPSSDAFAHPRDIWLAKQNRLIRSPISPALRRTFDVGHFWHGYLENIMLEMGIVFPKNVERYITHEIATHRGTCIGAGTADLVDVDIPGHGAWLIDIKTMGAKEFDQGASRFTFKKWEAQVSCYMDWFNVDRAMVFAVRKDSPHTFREYQIVKNEQLLKEIYDRWTFVAECLRTNTEPEGYEYEADPLLLNPGDSVFDFEEAKDINNPYLHGTMRSRG